jgi:hypothetical protein
MRNFPFSVTLHLVNGPSNGFALGPTHIVLPMVLYMSCTESSPWSCPDHGSEHGPTHGSGQSPSYGPKHWSAAKGPSNGPLHVLYRVLA